MFHLGNLYNTSLSINLTNTKGRPSVKNFTNSLLKSLTSTQPYHILPASAKPFEIGLGLFSLVLIFLAYFQIVPITFISTSYDFLIFAFIVLFFNWNTLSWFLNILLESAEGFHTRMVRAGIHFGILLFICSEVMFFFAFFWSFFHYALVPSDEIGSIWPSLGTPIVDKLSLPLLNTVILLTSGLTITLAHHFLLTFRKEKGARIDIVHFAKTLFLFFLAATIILGVLFLCCQVFEYAKGLDFTWRGNLYGSLFFIMTGFHGLHVTIGTIALLFCFFRHIFVVRGEEIPTDLVSFVNNLLAPKNSKLVAETSNNYSFKASQNIGFEATAWYWHFVDVVWLLLFIAVYWWGEGLVEVYASIISRCLLLPSGSALGNTSILK
jgi:heme/copper-type cytochrome/quinol oxidase subunit 3